MMQCHIYSIDILPLLCRVIKDTQIRINADFICFLAGCIWNFFQQTWLANIAQFLKMIACKILIYKSNNRFFLRNRFLLFPVLHFLLMLSLVNFFPPSGKIYNRNRKFLLLVTCIHFCRSTAVCRLKQLKDFVIAHQEIRSTGFSNFSRQRCFNDFSAIFRRLYFQTQTEFRVTVNLRIDLTLRFLRCKNQVNTQCTSDSGSTFQLLHEIWKLCFQFRKLIHNNNQMRKRCFYFF